MEFADTDWINGISSVDFASPMSTTYASDNMTEGFFGGWSGTLQIPDGKFDAILHLWPGKEKSIGGVLETVNEDTPGLLLAAVHAKGGQLHFEVPSVGGTYQGTLDEARAAIDGTWSKGGMTSKLSLTRVRSPP